MKSSKTTPSSGSGPVNFILNGTTTAVNKDTVTPANSRPLPTEILDSTGAHVDVATAANQVLEIAQDTITATKTTSIDSKLGTLGQKLMAGSAPVTFASDQTALPLSPGASTSAAQASQLTQQTAIAVSAASIDTKTPALVGGAVPVTGPLTDIQLRASAVPVSMAAVPVGAATAANQTSQITQETAIAASVASVDTKLTNVATSIKQSDGSQKTQVVDGSGNVISSSNVLGLQRLNVSLAAGGIPGAIAPAFTDVIGGVDTATGFAQQFQVDASKNLKVNVQTSALPLLASTSTKQSDGTQKTQIVDPANASITSTLIGVKQRLDVSLAAGAVPGAAAPAFTDVVGGVDATTGFAQQLQVDTNKNLKVVFGANAPGRTKVNLVRNDYGTTPVTTAAYVQLIASTSAISNLCETFDSSGQTLVLAVGAVGSEIDQFYINPGGNGQVPLLIPIASRVSIKAVTATANVTGSYLNLTLYS